MGNNCGATAGTSGVNVNNGNLVLTYGLPGAGPVDPPLRLFYNSMANDDSMNSRYGLGWSEMYFQWVEESQNATSNGENIKTYLSEMISPAGLKWVFDRHASGETKSIQCPDSSSVTYGYDARGNLASIIDSVGRTTLVSIDSNGLLLSITDPESGVTSFGYDENDQLISWQNPSGNTTFFEYDSCFRVKSITTPKGEVTRYKYRESEPRQRIVTNARGFVTTLTLDDYGNVVTSQEPVSASETITEEYQWDAKQRLLSFKDGRNNRTTFTYEEMTDRSRRLKTVQRPIGTMAFTYGDKDNARLTSIADQENNITTLQWEFLESGSSMYPGGLTTLTDAENKNWLYEYNSAGQITTITDPNFLMASSWGFDSSYRTKTVSPAPGEVTTFTYDQYSRVEQTNSNITTSTFAVTTTTRDLVNRVLLNTDANGLSTILEYDVDGLNDDVIDPMGGSWPKTYDLNGRLESTSTPENSKTTFTYDEVGNRITSKSPRGYTTTFTFDRLNRLIQTEDPLTRKTYQTFDAASNLQSVANNLLETTNYTYDANNRRTEELDPLSRKTTFAYDKVGNETGATNNANEKTTTTYDARYMVKTVSSPVGGVTSRVTNTYDAGGRLIQIENALGNKSYIGYDNANRPITATTPEGFVTTTVYDSMGRPIVVINAESERVTTVYDPGGRVTNTIVSPDGSRELVTSYSYDDNGNQTGTIVTITSLTSATSGTVYDGANRVIANVDPLGHRTTYTLDADGNRVGVTNAMGEMSSSLYNFANELTVEFTPMGFDTVYEYDGAGRLNRVVDANGNVTTTMYDPAGQPTTVINGAGDTSETYYDAVGRPEVLVDGAFVRTTIVYYPGGLEKNRYMQPKAGVSLIVTTMQYDAAGRLTTAINGAGDTVVTEYDTDDRLTTVINGEGEQTITYYDKVNRPTIVQNPLGQLFTTYYDGMGREINTVDAVANTTTTVYDYASRPVNEINGAGNKTTTTYDLAGRITAVTDGSGRTVTTDYDDANRPVTVTAGGGLERTVTNYDPDGRPTTVTNAASDVTVTEFDAGARPIAVIDGVGNITTTVYDGANRPTVVVNPKFERTTTTYDGAGRVVAVENARGNTTTYDYDDAGRQICVKTPSPLNERTTTTYDDANRVIAVEDARGNSTTTQYDKASRPTTVTDPLGKLTVTEYDAAGRPTTLTNAESEKTVTDYDSAGRPTTVTRPLGIVVSTDFDGANRPVSVTTGGGSIPFMTSVTVYDGAGRPEVLIDPRTKRTTTTYDAAGRPFKVEDAENNVTTTVYDGAGRVKEVINAESDTTTTLYDHAGRMTTLINGRGKITTYHYDVASRMDYKIDPLSRRTTFTYDAVGNLKTKQMGCGTSVENFWDVNNRLTVEAYSDGARHTYTYDAVGNRTVVDGPHSSGKYTMTYSARNELLSEWNPDNKRTTYTYHDVVNRRETLVDPDDGTTTYSYDAAGRQEVITNPRDKATEFSYDTANRQTQKSLPNEVLVEWTHDKNGNILSIYTSKSDGSINKRVTYTYDDVNNKTSQIDQDDRLVQWTYDNVYRLRNEECSVAPPTPYELFYSITYTYDDAGNRDAQTKTEGTDPAEVTDYTNDAADQLSYEVTTIGTTVSRITYTYDGCGNRTVKETASGDVYYSYSAANQMLTQDSASGTVTMSYNGMYQRIQKESGSGSALTNFIYDMNRLLAETDVNGDTTKSYTSETDGSSYGGMISEYSVSDMAEAYPDYDAQWSTKDLIDENGNSTAVYRNTAFGLPSPEPTNVASLSVSQWSELSVDDSSNLGVGDEAGNNGFGAQAGYYNDQETDLYLMGGGGQGRYYDPEVGRFTTQDPIGEAGGINLTQFVNNNPVNATDSSGNFTDEIAGLSTQPSRSVITDAAVITPRLVNLYASFFVEEQDVDSGSVAELEKTLGEKLHLVYDHSIFDRYVPSLEQYDEMPSKNQFALLELIGEDVDKRIAAIENEKFLAIQRASGPTVSQAPPPPPEGSTERLIYDLTRIRGEIEYRRTHRRPRADSVWEQLYSNKVENHRLANLEFDALALQKRIEDRQVLRDEGLFGLFFVNLSPHRDGMVSFNDGVMILGGGVKTAPIRSLSGGSINRAMIQRQAVQLQRTGQYTPRQALKLAEIGVRLEKGTSLAQYGRARRARIRSLAKIDGAALQEMIRRSSLTKTQQRTISKALRAQIELQNSGGDTNVAPRVPKGITNKFPNEALPADGRSFGEVLITDTGLIKKKFPVTTVTGKSRDNFPRDVDFVVTMDNKLVIGYRHAFLANRGEVLAAGRLEIRNGKVVGLNNHSGHYRPTIEEASRIPEVLRSLGVDLKDARFIATKFKVDSRGYITPLEDAIDKVLK